MKHGIEYLKKAKAKKYSLQEVIEQSKKAIHGEL
jgi:hypothetical protein